MSEHPQTRRARFATGRVNELQHKLYQLQNELEQAQFAMLDEFRKCEALNLPPEPWENHWRIALDVPVRGSNVYTTIN